MTEDPRVCLETCTPRREAAAMEWILLADIEFAEKPAWLLFRLQENRPLGCGPLVCGLRRKKQLFRKWGAAF